MYLLELFRAGVDALKDYIALQKGPLSSETLCLGHRDDPDRHLCFQNKAHG
jgi:hypothetical protein